MKHLAALLTILALAVMPGAWAKERPERRGYANPTAAIAAELAFARLAQDEGLWSAYRETAASEAEMFVPQRTNAQVWLKGKADLSVAVPVKWQPHAVWSSCDGAFAVTSGRWEGSGSAGSFATLWQRQPKRGYKWLLHMRFGPGQTQAATAAAPDMITAMVADCTGPGLPVSPGIALRVGDDVKTVVSQDGSLRWTSTLRADGRLRFTLAQRRDGEAREVLDLSGAAATAE